jgi:hypothetical protein
MPRTVWFRALLLVLALALTAPAAFAADREPAGPSVRGVLSALWEAFAQLIPWVDGESNADSGPGMDPNG